MDALLINFGGSKSNNARYSDIHCESVIFDGWHAAGETQSFDQHPRSDLHINLPGIQRQSQRSFWNVKCNLHD